ncbi:hypothetical protein M5K25_008107 [Dendrobium thyrsiflorum]|uniref:Fe2OG dioxygenase domain-containing protein n=1 Tax=Dendrobium thyrsiflorum TaxID=117978 RepID=A0ABD0V7V5_DENTH
MEAEGFSVPIIDLAKFEVEKEKLRAAVVELGCFRVINHGIHDAIIADMKASVRNILELPFEVKRRNINIIPESGYVRHNQWSPLLESLGIYDANSTVDIHAFCFCLGISSHDKENLSTYTSTLHCLIVDLASKIAERLGVVDYSFQEWSCHLRMNIYNFTKETISCDGLDIHTDGSFISVLLEDESNDGLEFINSEGNSVVVNHVPGTFLINVGDIGKVWSNGRLHNIKHKVICKKAEPRLTVVLFMLAPKDNKIEPRAELIDSENPRLYRSFDFREYRKIKVSTPLGFSVPIIDLVKFEVEKEKLRAAVVELGCFRVINHGIHDAIIADMKASARNILELPSEVKHRNINIIPGSGYIHPNQLSPLFESLGIYDANSIADIHAFCSCLGISSHDKENLTTYASTLHSLTVDLASKIAECLGVVDYSFQEWSCHLRMNRYNFTKENIGCDGAYIHTDSSFISVLLEDESNDGFEFINYEGNSMVWSNGRLHNVKHKVVCKKAEPRFTVVLFILAPKDNKIEPRVELIDYENPQLYRNVIMAMEEISVPVIDLAKFEAEKEKLMEAVVGIGCFRVINHGITETIIADMKVSARNILELPSEVKHRNTDVISGSGYVYPNRLNPLFESLGIYDAKSTANIHAFCSCLGISSHDTKILSTYASALHGLIVDLASKIAECLGIVDCSFQEWSCHLRMNRYNFTKETIGHDGAHVHTDNSFINVILEDESNEGFEMMNFNGNFVAVNHVPETFLINVGDIGKVSARNILELSSEVKHRNTDVIPRSGYVYPNRLNPFFESLGIYDAKSTAGIHALCSCLGISSHDIEILSTYASALHGLIMNLASKIAKGLGIVDSSFQEWSFHLPMNRYNFTKETIVHYGANVHTDNSFINDILEDESNERFEMMNSNRNFVAVNQVSETFIINVSIMQKPEPRFSIAFFILASEDNKIEPHAESIDSEKP